MQAKYYLIGGAAFGLAMGLLLSRGSGILIMFLLSTALGGLLSLLARDADQ